MKPAKENRTESLLIRMTPEEKGLIMAAVEVVNKESGFPKLVSLSSFVVWGATGMAKGVIKNKKR